MTSTVDFLQQIVQKMLQITNARHILHHLTGNVPQTIITIHVIEWKTMALSVA